MCGAMILSASYDWLNHRIGQYGQEAIDDMQSLRATLRKIQFALSDLTHILPIKAKVS